MAKEASEEPSWLGDVASAVGNLFVGVWDGVSDAAQAVWESIPFQTDEAGDRDSDGDSDTDNDQGSSEQPELTPEQRSDAAAAALTNDQGELPGVEDSKGVRMVDPHELSQLHSQLRKKLGDPTNSIETPKGKIETWVIGTDPQSTVTYRTFSKSGGPTLDVNDVEGLNVKRFHVTGGGN